MTSRIPAEPGPLAAYQAFLAEGRFMIQRCDACGAHVFYPRALCVRCGDAALSWVAPSGRGEVYSTSIVRRRPETGGDLNVCLVDLEEGVRLMSRVEDMPPAAVRIGMRVEARVRAGEAGPLLVFVAEGAPA